MIHSVEDKTKKELVEIVKIQMEEYSKLLNRNVELEQKLNDSVNAHNQIFDALGQSEKRLAEVERGRDDYKRIAIDAATESFLIAADNEIKRALAQDNKSASAINHCQQQFHRAARSCAIDCVNNQLRQQLNGGE